MKRFYCLLLAAGGYAPCSAQDPGPVARAEYDFARYALQHGARAAFLRYMDSSSVVFNKGRVLNARRYWQVAHERGGLLLWEPVFTAMSADSSSGFTTGPFEFRRNAGDSLLQAGQYTTVWRRHATGGWHFFADLGISYTGSLLHTAPLATWVGHQPSPAAGDTSVTVVERRFVGAFHQAPHAAFAAVCTADTWFNTTGQPPARGEAGLAELLRRLPPGITFTPLAGFMAQSRDLAYIYGIVHHRGKQENYLRVWAHTRNGWKLLVQVLKW